MKHKPAFCPICGKVLNVVRHVAANVFEVMCEDEACKIPCVVMTNDHIKL